MMNFPTETEHTVTIQSASVGSRGPVSGICVLLAVAVFLVFGQTCWHEFVNFDDNHYVYEHSQVTQGLTLKGVAWTFTHFHHGNWHPLTTLSYMLDCQLWGLDAGRYHLTNVFLHALNVVLLFLVLNRMTGGVWRSAVAAALFATHPLYVEPVAWISGRKDLLSMLFFILTLGAYLWYVRRSGWHRYTLVILSYALGLMSKAMLVTMPLLLMLLDFWPLGRLKFGKNERTFQASYRPVKILIAEKLPLFLLAGVASVVAFVAQKSEGALRSFETITFPERLANTVVNYVFYISKTFWPTSLAIPYPMSPGILLWKSLGCGLVLLLATALIARSMRRFPYLCVGWFWYLIALLPVVGLAQVGIQSRADRYTYLPLVGVFILVAWGAGEMFQRWRLRTGIIWGVVLLVLAACIVRTMNQLRYWKNSETLFSHAIAVTQANATAHFNLGVYYSEKRFLDEALSNYSKAIQIRPTYDDALINLGGILCLKHQPDEAAAMIREAIRLKPDRADAYYNLGNVLVLQQRLDDAASAYTQGLRIKPDYAQAHNNLANVLLMQGHKHEAAQHFQEVLRLNPKHEGARRQLRDLGMSE